MSFKEEFLRLLKEDLEFRYAVLGYLGLDEVIKSIKSLQEQVLENTKAIKSLQKQFLSLQKQVSSLQEQVLSLQEQVLEQSKILNRGIKVLEDHSKAIRSLKEKIGGLEYKVSGLTSALIGIRHALGVSLEEFAKEFLKGLLEARGVPKDKLRLERKILKIDGEEIEINIFNEDPLIIGEVTSIIEDIKEVDKVIERIRAVEKVYGNKPEYTFLIAPTIWNKVFKEVTRKIEENNIELIYGRVV